MIILIYDVQGVLASYSVPQAQAMNILFYKFSCSAIRDEHSGLAETAIIIHDNATHLSHTIKNVLCH